VEVFTDAGSQGANRVAHVPVYQGMWQTSVTVSPSKNITATVTDTNGNTSEFALFGPPPPDTSPNSDYSLALLAGADPNNPAEAPANEGAVVVDQLSVTLNFARNGKDVASATLRLVLPAGFVSKGATVALQFGTYIERVTPLDANGSGPRTGNVALNLRGASKIPGAATGGSLFFSVRNEDLKASWASCGMANETTTGKQGVKLTVPAAVALVGADGAKYVYTGSANLAYKAVKGKMGKATISRE
jgi:hypothetical protein